MLAFSVICLPTGFALVIFFLPPAFVTAVFVRGVLPTLGKHTPSMHKTAPLYPVVAFHIMFHRPPIYPSPLSLPHYSPYAVACVPHLSQNCYQHCQLPRWKQSHPLLKAKDEKEIKKSLGKKKKGAGKEGKLKEAEWEKQGEG